MYSAKVTLKYDSTWTHTIGSSFGNDILPEEHVTYEFPVEDATSYQMFKAFGKFMLMIGHSEQGVAKGAALVAFNEMRSTEAMRKTAEEYDLKLVEDYNDKLWEIEKLDKEIRDLKAKLSRLENPDNPQYTEEEMGAMSAENEVTADTLKNADVVCKDCGSKYGHYSVGCSSTWIETCNVCGQEKPVTEVRDWNYLKEGIDKLSK